MKVAFELCSKGWESMFEPYGQRKLPLDSDTSLVSCRSRILDRLELLDYFRQAMKDGRHANYCPSNHIYSIFVQV